MSYTITLRHTIGQEVWILPFDTRGKIIEISINASRIVFEVRYIQGSSICFSYLYEDELEAYKGQDTLTGNTE